MERGDFLKKSLRPFKHSEMLKSVLKQLTATIVEIWCKLNVFHRFTAPALAKYEIGGQHKKRKNVNVIHTFILHK